MTQYFDVVERQRLINEATDWAEKVKAIHAHSLDSMYYDNRPEDTADGKGVTDVEYNSGVIVRYQNGEVIHTFGVKLTGDELLDSYTRYN